MGPATTIFTRNATEAINLVAYAWGRENVGPGDEVLITEMEHHSNIVPWQLLCQERGARAALPVRLRRGRAVARGARRAFSPRGACKLVGVVHVSNVLGTINPVAEVTARARAAGAVCLVDGSQAVPQLPFDVSEVGADFYAWTGHKALGPTGIGVLHGRRELLRVHAALPGRRRHDLAGGLRVLDVERAALEVRGRNVADRRGQSGLGAAIDYLSGLGMEAVRAHEVDLTGYALERLGELPGVRVLGPADVERRGGVVSFEVEGMHPHDVAELCDREAVCIRAGHHCAQPLMRRMGVPATARASFHVYNAREDVDRLVEALAKARSVFGL